MQLAGRCQATPHQRDTLVPLQWRGAPGKVPSAGPALPVRTWPPCTHLEAELADHVPADAALQHIFPRQQRAQRHSWLAIPILLLAAVPAGSRSRLAVRLRLLVARLRLLLHGLPFCLCLLLLYMLFCLLLQLLLGHRRRRGLAVCNEAQDGGGCRCCRRPARAPAAAAAALADALAAGLAAGLAAAPAAAGMGIGGGCAGTGDDAAWSFPLWQPTCAANFAPEAALCVFKGARGAGPARRRGQRRKLLLLLLL